MTVKVGIYEDYSDYEDGRPPVWVKFDQLPRAGDRIVYGNGREHTVREVVHDAHYVDPPETYLLLETLEECNKRYRRECALEEAAKSTVEPT